MGTRPQPLLRRHRISQNRRAHCAVRSSNLRLAFWAPRSRASADGGVAQRSAMARADAGAAPALMNEPAARRIGEIFTESFERAAHDEFRLVQQRGAFVLAH